VLQQIALLVLLLNQLDFALLGVVLAQGREDTRLDLLTLCLL
jgi:hypothetical protein